MKSYQLVTYHDYAKPSEILFRSHSDPKPFGWSSMSGGKHLTEAECREANGVPHEPCKLCGMIFSTNFVKPVKDKLLALNICHGCNHWQEITRWKTPGFRIGGVHWKACAENSDRGMFKGCGGRRFVIRKLDTAEEITSSNLWCQGRIPAHFRDLLPDNAEFVPEEMPKATGPGFYAYP